MVVKRIEDKAEKNVVEVKNEIAEKLSVKEDEEKKEDSRSISDDEEYFSNSDSASSSDIEEEIVANKVEEDDDDDDAYALLAMAKRSLAQAKETEEKLKAEEEAKIIKEAQMEAAAEAEDDDDDDTVFDDDDDIDEDYEGEHRIRGAESIVEAKIELTSDTHVNAEKPSVETEKVIKSVKVEIDNNEQVPENVSEQGQGKIQIDINSEAPKVVKEAVDDVERVEPPKKRREENAELWALLQASKQRLSMTQHLLDEDLKEKATSDSKNDSVDESPDDENKDQIDSSTILSDDTQNQKLDSNNTVQQLTTEQNLSADAPPQPRATKETDAEAEKQRRRQENAELWELLVQSKRRLEIANPTADETATSESSDVMNSDSAYDTNKGKTKDYFNDYILPDEAAIEESNTKSNDERYDGEDEDEAAIRLSAKELLVAMAVAEEAAISGKDSHQTTIVPRTELKRELDTFSFIKSKCSISGPKSSQKTNSEQNDNTYASSVTSWWYTAPKRENLIDGFIKSMKGFRSRTPSKMVSPYKTKSPYGATEKGNPSSGSGSINKNDSTSKMIQSLKNSMKDFQQTVNTIDSKNAAVAKKNFMSQSDSGTKVVATPTKRTKWQERAATVAEKNKK